MTRVGTDAPIDDRLAFVLGAAAVALSAVAGVIWVWGLSAPAAAAFGWVMVLLSTAIVPLLTAAGLLALLVSRGSVSARRGTWIMGLAAIALALNALTWWAWSLGFDAADRGVQPPVLATLWLPLLVAALLLGMSAIALLIEPLLAMPSGRLRVAAALFAGLVIASAVGLASSTPYLGAIAALALMVVAALTARGARRHRHDRPTARPLAQSQSQSQARAAAARRALVRLLAVIAAVGGILGVLYAFTGWTWSSLASDGTEAMAQGITILLLCAVPLLAAAALAIAERSRIAPRHTWGPLGLVAAAFAAVALAYQRAPDWTDMAPWLAVGAVIGGTAIAWGITPRLPLARAAGVTIGVLAGLVFAAFLGTMLAPVLAFAVPIAAIALAIWSSRARPRADWPDPGTPLLPGAT